MDQGSSEWLAIRCGQFTASKAAALMDRTQKGLPTAKYQELIETLAIERITGEPVDTFVNYAMQRGLDLEPEAIEAYAFEVMTDVHRVGYVMCADVECAGASPDGLVGDDGLVEIKCPESKRKHLSYLLNDAHADEYKWQLQHQLMATGRAWVDIVSYDPRFPAHLQLAICRVGRDDEAIGALRAAIKAADIEVNRIVTELNDRIAA